MKIQDFYHALRKHHAISDRLRSLTRPLVQTFNLAQFCYFSVDSTGDSVALSTYPAWMEYYMNQCLFAFNPFLKSPDLVPEGVYLARGMKNLDYHKSRKQAEAFGIQESLVLTLKSKDKLTGFSFGLKSDIYQNSLIMNEIPLLKNYCDFFLKEGEKAIHTLESEPINVIPLLGESFTSSREKFGLSASEKGKLFSLMGIDQTPLSHREKECLRLYLIGETAKSIAYELGLSKRTVESYLENIKIKLNCFSKTDLLKKGKQLLDGGVLSP